MLNSSMREDLESSTREESQNLPIQWLVFVQQDTSHLNIIQFKA